MSTNVTQTDFAKVLSTTTKATNIQGLLGQYGCGPIRFVGAEDAFYERHLIFDRAIDPKVASARERCKAVSNMGSVAEQ
jgi:glycogen phosphorylase